MTDSAPELVEQMLRQAGIHAGYQHVRAERFEFPYPRPQLFLILLVRHSPACLPDAGPGPVRSSENAYRHTNPLSSDLAHRAARGRALLDVCAVLVEFGENRPNYEHSHFPWSVLSLV